MIAGMQSYPIRRQGPALRALAYHIQERSEGGLSESTRRRLAKLAGLTGEVPIPRSPRAYPGLAR